MCDLLVALPAATATGVTIFAKNSDRPPSERQVGGWSPARRDGGVLRVTHLSIEPLAGDTLACWLSRPEWCWGAEHGVNEAGVAAGNATIYTTLDPRGAPPALIGMDLVRLALERATTAGAAVAVITGLLERYGQGGSGHAPGGADRPYWSSFLVADPTAAFVVETSGREWAVLAVDDVAAISNRTTIPSFDAAHHHPRQPVARLVDPRLAASRRVLAARPVTVESVMDHLATHDAGREVGWTVCMHVPGVEETTASMVAALPVGGAPLIWAAAGAPCRTDYEAVTAPA